MHKILIFVVLMIMVSTIWSETVYEIQYTTDPGGASPLDGQIVTVTGIVTATDWYVSGNANRFFISDPEGGEWRGIFVFNYDFFVELGDEVEVTALVQEYFGFTELSSLTDVSVLSSGNPVPDPLVVTTGDLAGTEAYESVLVQVNNVTVTVAPNTYGEAFVDDGSGECQTDDAMYGYEPVVGANYEFIIGIVDYSYDEYGLNPRFINDIGVAGEPGYIEGQVDLEGGSGNIEDVVVSTAGYTTHPDDSGEYDIELPPGTYNVTASLAGYTPQTITGIIVEEDETTSGINFVLTAQEEVTIYDIQYTEDVSGDSPYAGQAVTVSGIVTGALFGANNFFFMSSAEGGAWNGIYIYQYDYEVAIGDNVMLSGIVSEYFGFTEIGNITELTINSSGNTLPEPVALTTGELAVSEAYEGVLAIINDVTVTALPDENNEWYVDDGSGVCQIDDGFFHLDEVEPPIVLEDGMEIISITGLIDNSFSQFGLHPRFPADINFGQANDGNIVPVTDLKAYPNPFICGNERNNVTFSFTLQKSSALNLSVYNIRGQKITELAKGDHAAGTYQIAWNGSNDKGTLLPAGVYLYQLQIDGSQQGDKILLIR